MTIDDYMDFQAQLEQEFDEWLEKDFHDVYQEMLESIGDDTIDIDSVPDDLKFLVSGF